MAQPPERWAHPAGVDARLILYVAIKSFRPLRQHGSRRHFPSLTQEFQEKNGVRTYSPLSAKINASASRRLCQQERYPSVRKMPCCFSSASQQDMMTGANALAAGVSCNTCHLVLQLQQR